MGARTVIGCVWGAWDHLRAQCEAQGLDAPDYDWCEAEWEADLRRKAPAPAALPEWLRSELFWRWRRVIIDREPRRERAVQLSIFDRAASVGDTP